jgi:hypothetical protein
MPGVVRAAACSKSIASCSYKTRKPLQAIRRLKQSLEKSLDVFALTWLAERSRMYQLVSQLTGTSNIDHHSFGLAGFKAVGSGTAPYVDLPNIMISPFQLTGRPNSSTTLTTPEVSALFSIANGASVLESGMIEQTQPGSAAVSTVKLLDTSLQSDTVFDIYNPAISGDNSTYYTNTIRPQLTGYSSSDLSRIDSEVNAGHRVIAPHNGSITVNQWTGVGYYTINMVGSTDSVGALITGGLSGGFMTAPIDPTVYVSDMSIFDWASSQSPTATVMTHPENTEHFTKLADASYNPPWDPGAR